MSARPDRDARKPQGGIIRGMVTETISVPEIHCEHCKASIEGALAPIEGVRGAEVDIAAATVTVTWDETLLDRRLLVEAIEAQGYDVPA